MASAFIHIIYAGTRILPSRKPYLSSQVSECIDSDAVIEEVSFISECDNTDALAIWCWFQGSHGGK